MQSRLQTIVNDKRFTVLMLLCIVAYTALKFPFRSVADVFQTFFLIGFLFCVAVRWRTLTNSSIFKVLLVSLLVPVMSWLNAALILPDLAETSPSLGNFINLFYFAPIAFILNGNRTFIWSVWAALLFGLLLSIAYYSTSLVETIERAVSGERVDYGFYNLQHASAWAGTCLLITLGFVIKGLYARNYKVVLFAILANAPFTFILITTQTRQTFFGLVAALLLTLVIYLAHNRIKLKHLVYGFIALFTVTFVIFNYSGLKTRTFADTNTLVAIVSGDYTSFKDASDSSGIRYSLWYAGFQWAKGHLLLGGDRGISEHIIQTSPYTPTYSLDRNHRHLHSYYMEILVSYGLIGLTVILVLFALIYMNVFRRTNGHQFDEVRFIGLTFLHYWMIINMFEPHLLTAPGQLIHNVMIGTLFLFAATVSKVSLDERG